ncbi:MAG: DUF5615 family PIN-like protein [Candidatus Hydrogenedentota bacterium]
MKILLDENVVLGVADRMRQLGHDVKHVLTDCPGSLDKQILDIAAKEGRLLVTFDKGFGRLVFLEGIKQVEGIILFRVLSSGLSESAEYIANILTSRDDWKGHFSTVRTKGIRQVPL